MGLLSCLDWTGNPWDPMSFTVLVSEATKDALLKIPDGAKGAPVVFDNVVYKWDAKHNGHFRAMLTNTPRLDANVLCGSVMEPGLFVDGALYRYQYPCYRRGVYLVSFTAEPKKSLRMRCTIDSDAVSHAAATSLIWGDENAIDGDLGL